MPNKALNFSSFIVANLTLDAYHSENTKYQILGSSHTAPLKQFWTVKRFCELSSYFNTDRIMESSFFLAIILTWTIWEIMFEQKAQRQWGTNFHLLKTKRKMTHILTLEHSFAGSRKNHAISWLSKPFFFWTYNFLLYI